MDQSTGDGHALLLEAPERALAFLPTGVVRHLRHWQGRLPGRVTQCLFHLLVGKVLTVVMFSRDGGIEQEHILSDVAHFRWSCCV